MGMLERPLSLPRNTIEYCSKDAFRPMLGSLVRIQLAKKTNQAKSKL